jgi:hypothetical protein
VKSSDPITSQSEAFPILQTLAARKAGPQAQSEASVAAGGPGGTRVLLAKKEAQAAAAVHS